MKQILELVHSDVFGPVKVPSLGKSVYYVSFIDDFSRNTWIYFLKNKFEVFDRFKEFKALSFHCSPSSFTTRINRVDLPLNKVYHRPEQNPLATKASP